MTKQSYQKHRPKYLAKFHDYHALNVVQIKARKALYREANREQLRLESKAKYHAKREQRLAQKRAAYHADKKKFADRVKKYRLENPGKIQARNLRRKLREKMAPGSVKLVEAFYHSIRSRRWVKCYYCGERVSGKLAHIDHVISLSRNGNHAVENLAASCADCNLSKGPKLPHEWPKHPQMFLTI